MIRKVLLMLVIFLLISETFPYPLYRPTEHTPLNAVSELTSRLAQRPSRLQDPRLPPNVETIKKVAQILIMIGEQVIPGVIGESPPHATDPQPSSTEEIPNDPVADI